MTVTVLPNTPQNFLWRLELCVRFFKGDARAQAEVLCASVFGLVSFDACPAAQQAAERYYTEFRLPNGKPDRREGLVDSDPMSFVLPQRVVDAAQVIDKYVTLRLLCFAQPSATEERRFAARLRSHCAGAACEVTSCRVEFVRYEPFAKDLFVRLPSELSYP